MQSSTCHDSPVMSAARSRKITVLLLENQTWSLENSTKRLEDNGFSVRPVRDLNMLRRALELGIKPDVALIDISLDHSNENFEGFEAPAIIRAASPQTLCMALTGVGDAAMPEYLRRAMRDASDQDRFDGVITKYLTFDEVVLAINQLLEHGGYLEPGLERFLVSRTSDELTPDEKLVLQARRDGYSGPELTEFVHMSKRTVDRNTGSAKLKLKVKTVSEAVAEAVRQRLINPSTRKTP
jgi:DNA-binding NarL/FixJ family response regulator